ncbi:zinc ABC transporter substrate-binding protein [Sulfurovum sp. bin170]|uniref:metal ABC transporter substrate-binding protein n=1 Tax=Sulfurovum sp. bin170 TaxID=2695268 RepID=UPI0013DE9C81|nr:metal ABC transporter substrate-binding protein [Sulfurovum sp. bin170]NEW61212.1 zinc ABC transporter substrate-binding protein [Sulfurovum sp. bin170]
MKKILLITLLFSSTLFAKLNVATTYNYLAKITEAIGGDKVKVTCLANPKLDPHFVTPKPSLIGKLRREDLLIINGGQLEIGWLPPLLKSANNAKINVGQPGFLDVSGVIEMMDKPHIVSRAYGGVHPDGNPHFALDIYSVIPIAKLITLKLSIIDGANSATYRANLKVFEEKIEKLTQTLKTQMQSCPNRKVVQYHELFNYTIKSYNIESKGTIEPLPGITPSSKHTMKLINIMKTEGIKTILQDAYHEHKTAGFIADKTGAKVSIVPHDVGSIDGTDTLEDFYTMVAKRLCP